MLFFLKFLCAIIATPTSLACHFDSLELNRIQLTIMWRIRNIASNNNIPASATGCGSSIIPSLLSLPHLNIFHPAQWKCAVAASSHCYRRSFHNATVCRYTSNTSDASSNSYLRPIHSADPQRQSISVQTEPLVRERPIPTMSDISTISSTSTGLSGSDLIAHENREMDRAVRRQRRINAKKRNTDWRHRTDSRRSGRVPLPSPPPIYFPSPFSALPVVPYPRETLTSALIRVDKVPKSPGFGKEISRIRGQLAKYNFIARRQLELAEKELAGKLEERIAAFPVLKRKHADGSIVENASDDPFKPQLHPYDHQLIELTLDGGGKQYTSLLNHCRNLVQKIRGAGRKGLSGLNHSRSIADSRMAHTNAIRRMKDLWAKGDPTGKQDVDGGSGQKSGMELVEELRLLSRSLRFIPTVEFERNLLDVKRHANSYLSVIPQEYFSLPASALTFERLRPFLPPSPTYTFSLVGAPNVGKSSLLAALSDAKVEVRDFAFTTQSIQVGHLERTEEETPSHLREEALSTSSASTLKRKRARESTGYPHPQYTPAIPLTRVQLVDTPGLLFRPDAMRKPVEKLTLSLAQHVQPLILAFVLDPTGQSGSGTRIQRFLARELYARFSHHIPPHPLTDDTDPRNHLAHDPLYANVAAHTELQSLTRKLQEIPWISIRSKSDVKKREQVSDEVLARSTSGAEREVRAVEAELLGLSQANAAAEIEEDINLDADEDDDMEYDLEDEEEGDVDRNTDDVEQDEDVPIESISITTQSGLTLTSPPSTELIVSTPRPKLTRAEWKLHAMREHMQKYLSDAYGNILLDEEELLGTIPRQLPASVDSFTTASSTSSDPSDTRFSYRRPPLSSLPCLSVSVETGGGVKQLAAHIWFEVDRRESIRLERDYKEMKARIMWMRGEQNEQFHTPRIQPSTQQQQHLPQPTSHMHANTFDV
jgi:hypothetical protein